MDSAETVCNLLLSSKTTVHSKWLSAKTVQVISLPAKSHQEVPGRVAQSVGHPTHKSGVLGSIPGLATYFRFSFGFFKKGSCQLLAKVCARSTG